MPDQAEQDSSLEFQQAEVKPQTGKSIVVFSTKGGVGKTVVAVNLGVALAKAGKAVCLVDLDISGGGDLARMLGLTAEHTIVELAPQMRRSIAPERLMMDGTATRHESGIDIIRGLSHPSQMRQLDSRLLQVFFKTVKSLYDYVIVDSKGLSDQLIAAFDEANMVLLVTTPDIVSLYQTKWDLQVIESLLFPPQLVKAVLNRAESRGGVASQDARYAVPCEIVGEVPSDGKMVGTAVNQGTPVVTLYPQTRVADSFKRLADYLIKNQQIFVTHGELPEERRRQLAEKPKDEGPTYATAGLARLYGVSDEEMLVEDEDEIVGIKRRVHEKLVEELDLKRMDLNILGNAAQMRQMSERCKQVITKLLTKELGGMIPSREARTKLVQEILDEALGLGPLEELLQDATVTDVLVNRKDQIYVERRGKLEMTSKRFISTDQVLAVIERIVSPLGRHIDSANPMVDARLPDGSRVNAIIPPLSIKGPVLSIRKFGTKALSGDDFVRFDSITPSMIRFLRAAVLVRKNILISGGTGSGKTTMLNLVSSFIPDSERIITIEDAAELQLNQTHWVSLESRPANIEGKGQVMIRDLFRNALRMRPDRIVIGECRGPETLDMLQAMNTGHDGSFTTIHANSPKDVISRLDSMVLMSNVDLPVRAIREMVASAVHMIIHTARLADGSRKVISVSEVIGLRNEMEMVFRDLFVYKQTGTAADGSVRGYFTGTGQLPSFYDELRVKGVDVDLDMFSTTAPPDAA